MWPVNLKLLQVAEVVPLVAAGEGEALFSVGVTSGCEVSCARSVSQLGAGGASRSGPGCVFSG